MTRRAQIEAFLAQTDWANAPPLALTSDASFRRYFRLQGGPTPALLMDADPQTNAPITAFVRVAAHLRGMGLSAPEIYAADPTQGLAIIEDLGDALFARVTAADPAQEARLYAAATEVLIHLHRATPEGFDRLDAAQMADFVAQTLPYYAPKAPIPDIAAQVRAAASKLDPSAFTQRDFHAENLLWLPDRKGLARVGLLDFQDATLAPKAYDLVSLLSDARRDVSPAIIAASRTQYSAALDLNPEAFAREYDICGAQRSLRILGVFARLWVRDGKPGYLPLIPRVWAQLETHLKHPSLTDLRALCQDLPAPSEAYLAEIKGRRAP